MLPETLRLVDYVIVGGRPATSSARSTGWSRRRPASAAGGWRTCAARAEVDADQRAELAESLSRLVGNPVELQVILDPSLLVGAVVHVGDLQVDATATRLA